MPHATTVDHVRRENEEREIEETLQLLNGPDGSIIQERELELEEKADDAVDFGDLSDDDLADDDGGEDNTQETLLEHSHDEGVSWKDPLGLLPDGHSLDFPAESGENAEGLDDLFGEVTSSPVGNQAGDYDNLLSKDHDGMVPIFDHNTNDRASETPKEQVHMPPEGTSDIESACDTRPLLFGIADAALSKEQQMQQALFAMSASVPRRLEIPGPETQEQALRQLWPRFQSDTVPRFMDLLPPKKARYLGKPPLRIPKPLNPTKVSLDIATDQEKSFRLASASISKPYTEMGKQGFVTIQQVVRDEERIDEIEDLDSDFAHDEVAGVNWQDLQILCEDWDTQSSTEDPSAAHHGATKTVADHDQDDIWDDWTANCDARLEAPATKVRSRELPQTTATDCRTEAKA